MNIIERFDSYKKEISELLKKGDFNNLVEAKRKLSELQHLSTCIGDLYSNKCYKELKNNCDNLFSINQPKDTLIQNIHEYLNAGYQIEIIQQEIDTLLSNSNNFKPYELKMREIQIQSRRDIIDHLKFCLNDYKYKFDKSYH